MEALNLIQNSPEWNEHRAGHFNASDAPAMMGVSKFETRDQLLHRYKTGEAKEVDRFAQKRFDDGHRYEKMARPLAEKIIGEELYPVTGADVIDGLPLGASYDGLTLLEDKAWEHKSINDDLRSTESADDLDEMYKVQMDQQQLVSGAPETLFTAGDDKKPIQVEFWYQSTDERKQAIIDGWKQFQKDLEAYEIPETRPEVVAGEIDRFPVVAFEVTGTELTSNITDCLAKVKERAEIEMSRELVTDQDFADKEELNKATKQARADLKAIVKQAQDRFVSFSDFAAVAADLDSVLQKMQSHGEKLVKTEKDNRRREIANEAGEKLVAHVAGLESELNGLQIPHDIAYVDFLEPMKGKRSLESMHNAVNTRLAQAKIDADQSAKSMRANLVVYAKQAGDEYAHLFNDLPVVIHKQADDFEALVKMRVAQEQRRQEEIEAKKQADQNQSANTQKEASPGEANKPSAKPEARPGRSSAGDPVAETGFDAWWDVTGQHMDCDIESIARAAWNAASDPF